jgi:hypothetical protein
MKISFITVNRPLINYLDSTLDSLDKSDWKHTNILINLYVGNEDESYVEKYRHDDRITIVSWEGIACENLTERFNTNYFRGLQPDTIVCEDDIRFSPTWFARTIFAMGEIEKDKIKPYVLSLYTAQDFGGECWRRGNWYRAYWAEKFWGTQGVYYPEVESLRKHFQIKMEYMKDSKNYYNADLVIREWVDAHQCLYLTQGSVVQHVGRVSCGGQGTGFHEAWRLEEGF